ncbi:hypothetical protein GCM10028813_02180 [Ramlibacter alkalitolerans]
MRKSRPTQPPPAEPNKLVVPTPRPTPRFGVLPTKTERDRSAYTRKVKHRNLER